MLFSEYLFELFNNTYKIVTRLEKSKTGGQEGLIVFENLPANKILICFHFVCIDLKWMKPFYIVGQLVLNRVFKQNGLKSFI